MGIFSVIILIITITLIFSNMIGYQLSQFQHYKTEKERVILYASCLSNRTVRAIAHLSFFTSTKTVLVLNGAHVVDSDWRFDNLRGSILQSREPISRYEQFPSACATAFSPTSFLQRFLTPSTSQLLRNMGEFWISFKFQKPVNKTNRPKNDSFSLLVFLVFDILYFECAHKTWWRFYFRGPERCPKMCLKINWSVKTPWQLGLLWEFLAPGYGLLSESN